MRRSKRIRPPADPPDLAVTPTSVPADPAAIPHRRYGRWRALSLSLVYVLFAAHILHWKLSGRTLAPLELNEVMYTLELGIITAGFLFMCALVLGTLLFGRFFCSWACHIMVLQELCAWLLRRLGIRRKPIRSRLLLLIPPATAFYMFVWPQIVRAWHSRAFPEFHLRIDAEGWASFATTNFWRNLPSAPIIVLTFLVCGFLVVYLMGSRTFCTYVCPYGAIFALADRFAPGRIRVNDRCRQCGTCTATCTSGVRVHDEVREHRMIVNPACLKCLDCVSACPQNALSYGLAPPALFKSYKSGGRFGRLPYDFSIPEELLLAAVFLLCVLTFRGLYSRIPFLLSLAIGGVVGYLMVTALRLVSRPNVLLATWPLRTHGRLTPPGRAYVAFAVLLALFVAHSALVRYHEYTGLLRVHTAAGLADPARRTRLATSAWSHLRAADRWGLIHNERVERGLLNVAFHLGRSPDVHAYADRLLARDPLDSDARLVLAQSLAAEGRADDARRELETILAQSGGDADSPRAVMASAHEALGELLAQQRRFDAAAGEFAAAITLDPHRAGLHAARGAVLAELGRFDEAVAALREAVRLDPHHGRANYNLGTLLSGMGRTGEAIACYEQALQSMPEDADLLNNFGLALLQTGQPDRAQLYLERAVRLDAKNANAHFNLARLFASRRDLRNAERHFQIAVQQDPRYAEVARLATQE